MRLTVRSLKKKNNKITIEFQISNRVRHKKNTDYWFHAFSDEHLEQKKDQYFYVTEKIKNKMVLDTIKVLKLFLYALIVLSIASFRLLKIEFIKKYIELNLMY